MKTTEKTPTKIASEEIVKQLEGRVNLFGSLIKETIDNPRQFEQNYRNKYKADVFSKNLLYISEWKANIGKEVYKVVNSFTYRIEPEPSWMNKTESTPTLFTNDLFESLVKDIVGFWLNYYSEDLISRPITSNSTHKLSNLMFEWELECKQEIIEFYKEQMLVNYK